MNINESSRYNSEKKNIGGLEPEMFMCIASPFLGTKGYTFIPLPAFLETIPAFLFGLSGKELFHQDEGCLISKMCTSEEYLSPLASFKQRRLYSALYNDAMVPIQTGAFMTETQVSELRKEYPDGRGILTIVKTASGSKGEGESPEIASLNLLGWDKIIVNFGGVLPLGHLQICANERWPSWMQKPFGLVAGHAIMDDSAAALTDQGSFFRCQVNGIIGITANTPEDTIAVK
jgi:Putative serine esterase (DUF676)